jgi:hypothetical protein
LPGQQAVHGVGGDTLGGMDGAGIAETRRGENVVGGQPDSALTLVVPHSQVALFADMGDSPAVAVFDPVVGREAESAVVASGDDHIADTCLVSIG